ncbi:ankyrin repeats (3 copies) domain-containing protein [Trichoderma breve]|uniref:Ankyrin repeats (3 copies) domain-containing protein n=1 Tax=Trichoderma breve TaxID=2034170 RepID=A0A9W9E5K0_9HYPO|nr:ankyrin repeats (3 copies) domain-containing protein [Trichoderma breve]KAJ4859893.1 ankyrin repeats (3 copies) domain-containing protein [Trichoderma breve]
MDPVGLAVGVIGLAGLFSTCLDLVKRVDSYKHFKKDEQILATQFAAYRLRFERWGNQTALSGNQTALSEDQHEALADSQTLETVRRLIEIIREILSDQKLPNPINPSLVRSLTEPFRPRKEKLSWALKGKAKREDQVELFGKLIQHLYHLVPIDTISRTTTVNTTTVNGNPQTITVNGIQSPNTTAQIDSSWKTEVRDTLQRLEGKAYAETRRELHAWIVRHPPNEIYQDAMKKRLEATCEWILKRPVLDEWLSLSKGSQTPGLLWINGPAGFGKTILCSRLVQHLQKIVKTPVASYFFSSDFESRDDPYEAIRWWISEVISRSESAFDYVRMKREKQNEPTATRAFILEIFSDIIKMVPGCVFVIDGLDECTWLNKGNNPGRRDSITSFLENLDQAITNSATRVLIVSRDESEIRCGVEDMKTTIFEYSVLPEDVDSDTKRYARSIVDKKLSKKSEPLKVDISEKMAMKCGGQFLWLKLQEDSLRSWKNQKQLQDAIDTTPSGLDSLYHRSWVRLSKLPKDERDRAFSLLRWVTFAIRPLTVAEIAEAVLISFENEELPTDELPDSIDDDIRKSSIMLDPRVDTANEKLRSSNERTENITLAQLCLWYIHYEQIWQFENEQDSDQVQGSFRDYAAGYWHHHALNGSLEDELVDYLITSLFDIDGTIWEAWKEWFDTRERMAVEAYLEMSGDDDDERQIRQSTLSKSMPNNPVYYASKLDITTITLRLIEEYRHQLDEVSYFGETAIAAACGNGNQAISQALIDAGANIKCPSYDGETALHKAVDQDRLDLVMLLLENGADLNAVNNSSATALHYAAHSGHADVIRLLISQDSRQNNMMTKRNSQTPLHTAAIRGQAESVQLLLDYGVDISVVDEDGCTPLISASFFGFTEVVRILLRWGSDINAQDLRGMTALALATQNGHTKTAELLLQNGADTTLVDNIAGWTVLLHAAYYGCVDIFRALLTYGADINFTDPDGKAGTPLGMAIRHGHYEVVELLLNNGASHNAVLETDWLPLTLASSEGQVNIAKLFLGLGADINESTSDGLTPLVKAIWKNKVDMVQFLLENGADPSIADNSGSTALKAAIHVAAHYGHVDIIKLLLEKGFKTTERGADGWTPLHAAAHGGHLDTLGLFLNEGVPLAALDYTGRTALHIACQEGHQKVFETLLELSTSDEVNCPDVYQRTPLFYAAMRGHNHILNLLLLSWVADVHRKDFYGSTALFAAVRNGHEQIVGQLLACIGEIPLDSRDAFGKTVFYWARKCNNIRVIDLLCQSSDNASQTTDESDVLEHNCMPFNSRVFWCDDFVACLECITAGVKCLKDEEEAHQWVTAPEQLEYVSDEESSVDE